MSDTTYPRRKVFTLVNRLQLDVLPQPLRVYATALVVVALAACLLILLVGLGLYPRASSMLIPDNLGDSGELLAVPFSLILFVLLGFGVVIGSLIYASYQPGWTRPFLTRLTLGFACITVPLYFLRFSGMGDLLGGGYLTLQAAALFVAFASGVAALLSSFISSPRMLRLAPWFGMGAFIGSACAFIIWKIRWDFLARSSLSLNTPDMLRPIIDLEHLATGLVFLMGVFFFWQLVAEGKIFSREVGLRVANLVARLPWLLAALFALKLVWLAIGFWNADSGEVVTLWERSLNEAGLPWFLAAVFAAAAGLWLLRTLKPLGAAQLNKSAVFFTSGFLFIFILTYLILFLGQLLLNAGVIPTKDYQPLGQCFTVSQGSPAGFISCLGSGLSEYFLHGTVLFVASLLPLGFIFLRIKSLRALAPVCFLAGIWGLPDAVGVIALMMGRPEINPAFEYLSFDVFLTLVLLFFAVQVWRGKAPRAHLWMITLVLVVSTLAALAETLVPPALKYFTFALLLIIPVVYQFLFDSDELNTHGRTQGTRILWTLAWQAGLMVVVAWAFTLGRISPQALLLENVAAKIFLPVFVGFYLVNMRLERESGRLPTS